MGWLGTTIQPVNGASRSRITNTADAIDTAPSVITTSASALRGAIRPKHRKIISSQKSRIPLNGVEIVPRASSTSFQRCSISRLNWSSARVASL